MGTLRVYSAADSQWYVVGGSSILLDEDTMVSDSASYGATQQSIKAYVDASDTALKGLVHRPKFEYKDADEVTMGAGSYHHSGTVEQMVYWSTSFDVTVTATSGWNYLYIDDSAIVSGGQGGTESLVSTNFIFSTTAPTWSNDKHGWYNGNDRCIFATHCTAASTQRVFYHGDDLVTYDEQWASIAGSTGYTSWTNATVNIPGFATRAEMNMWANDTAGVGNPHWKKWRTDGSSGAGHYCCVGFRASGTYDYPSSNFPVITSSSQLIEIQSSISGHNIYLYTDGWYFPVGM